MSGSIIDNKQNLGKYVILRMILLRFSGAAIQEDVSEEELGDHDFLSLPQCAGRVCSLTRLAKALVLAVPDREGFQCAARTMSPGRTASPGTRH